MSSRVNRATGVFLRLPLVPYLKHHGFEPPRHENPLDFALDVLCARIRRRRPSKTEGALAVVDGRGSSEGVWRGSSALADEADLEGSSTDEPPLQPAELRAMWAAAMENGLLDTLAAKHDSY
ncbi:hypothetical protein T492DRAFT_847499 [Pavlovales sp. CCMP2436]|nr:hypothetical protein T492DRAFT_847499 [Pavlovales sp. CCMP2436]